MSEEKKRQCFVKRCRGEVRINVGGLEACDEHTQLAWDNATAKKAV